MFNLEPSKLGTQEYWDAVYSREVANFEELGDIGETWFGVDSVDEIVEWAQKHIPPSKQPSILEVGSGNGTLLLALVEAGYDANKALGIDYSSDAVKLATSIARSRGCENITFSCVDFIKDDPPMLSQMDALALDSWDLIVDKGTFDAIALSVKDESEASPEQDYSSRIARLLKPGGLFHITSCNFTEEELQKKFASPETKLVYHSRIHHPTYTFGGQRGSTISSMAFCKPTEPNN